MTLRAGTSKTGKVHKYYTCSTCMRQGKSACKGRSIAIEKPTCLSRNISSIACERLAAVLASAVAQRAERSTEVNRRPATLKAEVLDAEEKLKRLYKMVGDALTNLDEILKARIAELKLDRERAPAALDRVPAACVIDQHCSGSDRAIRPRHARKHLHRRDSVPQGPHPVCRGPDRSRRCHPDRRRQGDPGQVVAGSATNGFGFAVSYASGAPDTIRTCGLRLRRATLYPAELRVLTAYAVLTRISCMSEPQRAALASLCNTILFLPHFSHQPA